MVFSRLGIVATAIAGITLLGFAPSAHAADVTLIWTAPGDDGYTGIATSYDLRYSTTPINDGNFAFASRVMNAPSPRQPGSLQFHIVQGLQANLDYFFALKTCDERGNWSAISNIAVHTGEKLASEDSVLQLAVSPPSPNPARFDVRFEITLPTEAEVDVRVFDITGRELSRVASGVYDAGRAQVSWNLLDRTGRRVAPGVYLVRARLGGESFSRRVLVTN